VNSRKAIQQDSAGKDVIDFQTLLEGSLDVVWLAKVKGPTHRYVYCSPSTAIVLGWKPEEMRAMDPGNVFTKEAMAIIANDVEKISRGEEHTTVLVEAVTRDGSHIWLENKVRVLDRDTDGWMTVAIYMRDVTDRKLLQDQLAHMAFVDGLTGIDNRRSFDEAIDREWKRALRSGSPLSLILFDVDHFKAFNDTYGHLSGDDCLRAIATTLRECIKRPEDLVARYGGEELAVLLPETETAGAEVVANRVCSRVRDLCIPHSHNDGRGIVTISGGVSTAISGGAGSIRMPEGLLQAADSALYKAKSLGRNQVATSVVFATPGKLLRSS
jgi:diguanylate cyclase (GGDEF)-like protein/PAS domain S-box-containing protein